MRQLECDQEKIHLCGKIQFFGFLFVFDETGCIAYSQNVTTILPYSVTEILGTKISQVLSALAVDVKWDLAGITEQAKPDKGHQFVERVRIHGQTYDLSLYLYDHRWYLELEASNPKSLIAHPLVYYATYLEERPAAVWLSLAELIRQIIRFDRVMVYQFEEDKSGRVVAEAKAEDMSSLLGYRYPEFDIPAQARALYSKVLARHVTDTEEKTIPIQGVQAKDLDLSCCSIRALSPAHMQYLRNAGVRASASFSILVEGKLWGLVTCQNREPARVDLAQRDLCLLLTKYAVNFYLSEFQKDHLVKQTVMGVMERELKSQLLVDSNSLAVFERFAPQILELCHADGLMMKHDRGQYTLGMVPNNAMLEEIDRLADQQDGDLFCTSELVYQHVNDSNTENMFPGVVRITILPSNNWNIYLFRKEHVYEEVWAGKPEKIYAEDSETDRFPSPRKSFDAWRQLMKGKSVQWKKAELSFMEKIVQIMQQAMAQRGGEIEQLNKELVRSNNALDTFGYTLTHDLKNPLSSIKLAAQMMQIKRDLSMEMLQKLATNIMDATELISEMLDKVYQLTKSTHVDFKIELIDPRAKILGIVDSCRKQYEVADLDFKLGEIHPIQGERTLLYQLFLNLIGNAIKYSAKKDRPCVEVYSRKKDRSVCYYIKDNGIGMGDDRKHIFDIFKRLDNSTGFEGSGIGLSIVKRIADRLGATLTVESELHVGTVFCVEFLNVAEG